MQNLVQGVVSTDVYAIQRWLLSGFLAPLGQKKMEAGALSSQLLLYDERTIFADHISLLYSGQPKPALVFYNCFPGTASDVFSECYHRSCRVTLFCFSSQNLGKM